MITLLVISACSSNKLSLSTEEKLKKADDYYARGKYARAAMRMTRFLSSGNISSHRLC